MRILKAPGGPPFELFTSPQPSCNSQIPAPSLGGVSLWELGVWVSWELEEGQFVASARTGARMVKRCPVRMTLLWSLFHFFSDATVVWKTRAMDPSVSPRFTRYTSFCC